MRVLLIHQPTAGDGDHGRDDLVALFEAEGHAVTYRSKERAGWAAALDDPVDLVVAAGGDGTVSAVASRLAGRGMPLAVLALGTANDVARALGLLGRPEAVVPRLSAASRRPLDVGVARGPWGERRFVEGVGLGAFASAVAFGQGGLLRDADTAERTLDRDLRLLRAILRDAAPRRVMVAVDSDESTYDALFVEVRNVGLAGPNVPLAPDADAGDGWLDVLVAGADARARLDRHLTDRIDGRDPVPLALPTRRARRVRLASEAARAHVDGTPWPAADEPLPATRGVEVDVHVEPGALEVLVPRRPGAARPL